MASNRYITLTLSAGIVAAISAIFIVGAPPIPAAAGVGLAVTWLLWTGSRRAKP